MMLLMTEGIHWPVLQLLSRFPASLFYSGTVDIGHLYCSLADWNMFEPFNWITQVMEGFSQTDESKDAGREAANRTETQKQPDPGRK